MAPIASSASKPAGGMFANYLLDAAYDEMFYRAGEPRPQCQALYQDLLAASVPELRDHQSEAEKTFLTQGITFTVYGDTQGTERIFPYDLLPSLITAAEWRVL